MVYAANAAKMGHLSHNGYPTGALYGSWRSIMAAVKLWNADQVYVCWDDGGTIVKRELFSEYKSGREGNTVARWYDSATALDHKSFFHMWVDGMGYVDTSCPGTEADDVIATLVRDVLTEDECFIMSKDHDFKALLDTDRVSMVWGKDKLTSLDFYDDFGMQPRQYAMYLALAGDPTDSVPGILKPSQAKAVVKQYEEDGGDLDLTPEQLAAYVRNVRLVSMGVKDPEKLKCYSGRYKPESLSTIYESLGMKSLLTKIGKA